MKLTILILAGILASIPAVAQRHKLSAINAETDEGKMLQAIGQESDAARKLQLMEEFVGKWGNHEAAGWVWSQMQPAYLKAGNVDKAIAAGDKLLALDAADLEAAYANLKAAEGKKDADAVIKYAAATSAAAKKAAQEPKKEGQSDEDYKHAVDYAKQVDTYSEYALYATALSEQDPQKVMKLTEAIEQQNPNSQYIAQAMTRYAWAGRAANALPNAVAFGERAYARNQFNEDLLLAMSDYYLNQPAGKQDLNKVINYSTKIVETLPSKEKPQGMSDADWEKKKTTTLGLAHWMTGTSLSTQGKYAPADKNLRVALPLVKDNEHLLAGALFHLGLSNYQMGRGKNAQQMTDAVKFFEQCAAMKSPFQAKAKENLAVMRKQAGAAK
jgi:hypothetical protein